MHFLLTISVHPHLVHHLCPNSNGDIPLSQQEWHFVNWQVNSLAMISQMKHWKTSLGSHSTNDACQMTFLVCSVRAIEMRTWCTWRSGWPQKRQLWFFSIGGWGQKREEGKGVEMLHANALLDRNGGDCQTNVEFESWSCHGQSPNVKACGLCFGATTSVLVREPIWILFIYCELICGS